MLYLNSCRKCITGAVEIRNGIEGIELKCINCGHEHSTQQLEQQPEHAA